MSVELVNCQVLYQHILIHGGVEPFCWFIVFLLIIKETPQKHEVSMTKRMLSTVNKVLLLVPAFSFRTCIQFLNGHKKIDIRLLSNRCDV